MSDEHRNLLFTVVLSALRTQDSALLDCGHREQIMSNPLATYRLQFNPDFGFAAANSVIDYLAALGVSTIYASPIFKARRGLVNKGPVSASPRGPAMAWSSRELHWSSQRLFKIAHGILCKALMPACGTRFAASAGRRGTMPTEREYGWGPSRARAGTQGNPVVSMQDRSCCR